MFAVDQGLDTTLQNVSASIPGVKRSIEFKASERKTATDALQVEALKLQASSDLEYNEVMHGKSADEKLAHLELQKEAAAKSLERQEEVESALLGDLDGLSLAHSSAAERCSVAMSRCISTLGDRLRASSSADAREEADYFQKSIVDRFQALLESHQKKVNELLARKDDLQCFRDKTEQLDTFAKEVDKVTTVEMSRFAKAKAEMTEKYHEAQLQLQKVLETFGANKDKLEYNIRVLLERGREYSAIQASYRSKASKLTVQRDKLAGQLSKADAAQRKENAKISQDIEKERQRYQELIGRLDELRATGDQRCVELRNMHLADVSEIRKRVVAQVEWVFLTIMGIAWQVPSEEEAMEEVASMHGASSMSGSGGVSSGLPGLGAQSLGGVSSPVAAGNSPHRNSDRNSARMSAHSGDANSFNPSPRSVKSDSKQKRTGSKYSALRVAKVLDLILNNMDFLAPVLKLAGSDSKSTASDLSNGYTTSNEVMNELFKLRNIVISESQNQNGSGLKEAAVSDPSSSTSDPSRSTSDPSSLLRKQTSQILKSLGVDSLQAQDLLVKFFYRGQDDDDDELYVEPHTVLSILSEYAVEKQQAILSSGLSAQMDSSAQPGAKNSKSDKKKRASKAAAPSGAMAGLSEAEVYQRQKIEEQRLWERLSIIVTSVQQRSLDRLVKVLPEYYKLLKARDEAMSEYQRRSNVNLTLQPPSPRATNQAS